jgi:hypothetical protein
MNECVVDLEADNDGSKDLLSVTDSRLTAPTNKIGVHSSLSEEGAENSNAAPRADNQLPQPDSPSNLQARGDVKGSMNQISSHLQPDHVEVFVNYDQEIDSLRKTFVSVISDYAVR